MEQIWNTYKIVECMADMASKIHDKDENLGFPKPLRDGYKRYGRYTLYFGYWRCFL